MTQSRLKFGQQSRHAKPLGKQRDDYDRRNLEAAWAILDNPEQHGGPDAFPSLWARLVVKRLKPGGLEQKAAA